jgi:hypothetical protein
MGSVASAPLFCTNLAEFLVIFQIYFRLRDTRSVGEVRPNFPAKLLKINDYNSTLFEHGIKEERMLEEKEDDNEICSTDLNMDVEEATEDETLRNILEVYYTHKKFRKGHHHPKVTDIIGRYVLFTLLKKPRVTQDQNTRVMENSIIHVEQSEKSVNTRDWASLSIWVTEFSVTLVLWSCVTLGFSNSVIF